MNNFSDLYPAEKARLFNEFRCYVNLKARFMKFLGKKFDDSIKELKANPFQQLSEPTTIEEFWEKNKEELYMKFGEQISAFFDSTEFLGKINEHHPEKVFQETNFDFIKSTYLDKEGKVTDISSMQY